MSPFRLLAHQVVVKQPYLIFWGHSISLTQEVLFNDQNVINLTDDQLSILRAQKIGFIFQSHYLLPQISVLENIFLPTIAVEKDEQDTPSIEDVKRLLEK